MKRSLNLELNLMKGTLEVELRQNANIINQKLVKAEDALCQELR